MVHEINNHIIVFVKAPLPGKVKTRIAISHGNDIAVKVYEHLLHHTQKILTGINANIHLFVDGPESFFNSWSNADIHQQQGNELGERMHNAFESILNTNPKALCCIIGSDCYSLTIDIISKAFLLLHYHNYVIGPASDGGYYLLGMKKLEPDFFENMEWSTSSVCAATEKRMKNFTRLPVLSDIDTWEDVIQYKELYDKLYNMG